MLNQIVPKVKFSLPTARSEVGLTMYEADNNTALHKVQCTKCTSKHFDGAPKTGPVSLVHLLIPTPLAHLLSHASMYVLTDVQLGEWVKVILTEISFKNQLDSISKQVSSLTQLTCYGAEIWMG